LFLRQKPNTGSRITLGSNAKSSLRRKPTRRSDRRFPPPWSIEDIGAAFVVKDANGQKLAWSNSVPDTRDHGNSNHGFELDQSVETPHTVGGNYA